MSERFLEDVTLVAATSINVDATLRAIEASQALVRFAACKLFTHEVPERNVAGVEIVLIPALRSSKEYSRFMLRGLAGHIETSHCLVVQWDGFVLDPDRWDSRFLDYDYIGASWPQFTDGHDVGNGGFSLRSRRLLEACRSEEFAESHPEDVAICRLNRLWLEEQGLCFAPRELADSFSAERASSPEDTFGFHGVWHMPQLIGADCFWDLYCGLEDRTSVYHDQGVVMRQLAGQPHGLGRCFKLGLGSLWKAPQQRTNRP